MTQRFARSAMLTAALMFGIVHGARAVEYTDVNPTASTISFTYNQLGSRV